MSAPYLLRAQRLVKLPSEARRTPEQITDWLARTLGSDTVRVERVSETVLEFHSRFSLLRQPADTSPYFVANGELDVRADPDGAVITVRANPHLWHGLYAVLWLILTFGWPDASAALRWGAGLGGLLVGGVVLSMNWVGLNRILRLMEDGLRLLRTKPSQTSLPNGTTGHQRQP